MSSYVCPVCGLDYDTVMPPDMPVALRSYPRRYAELVLGPDPDLDAAIHRRPEPTVWSALEYAAHVRDVMQSFADELPRMARETDPELHFFDPDERAAAERYNEQDPTAVIDAMRGHCERLADFLEACSPDDWERTAEFPWGTRDLLTMSRNAVHEGAHHLRDAEQSLGLPR